MIKFQDHVGNEEKWQLLGEKKKKWAGGLAEQSIEDAAGDPGVSQKTIEKPRTKAKPKTQGPPLWKVILLNDDYTPREFVVMVLKAVFRRKRRRRKQPKWDAPRDIRSTSRPKKKSSGI